MKKIFLTLGVAALVSLNSWAQDAEKRPITSAEFDAAKKIAVKNLEKDTYVKAGNFILDRVGDPFVFKFSDGTERRVYLYKLFETEKMAELGMYAIYTTPKDGKLRQFPLPSPDAAGDVWGKYIDELKYGEDAMKGMASCIAFVLTKSGVGGAPAAAQEGEKIEYCFPAEALVTLANGTTKAISEVTTGDQVQSYDSVTKSSEIATVEELTVHADQTFDLTRLTLVDAATKVTASATTNWETVTLEATANHPVLTENGVKKMSEVRVGDALYYRDAETNTFKKYDVFTTQSAVRSVNKVYNLKTDKATYVVNGTVVMTK
ncbi:hypothetical protein [Siphonobacter sp. SORGH_AS_0500]|uniref:hypothetical protein n=1 Tax=Siphonobacter sp. SORGH_AS_0500 TaxID=1864824 RepID=UPI0028676608|nr:hypothetical protein [Siphonobacter sp. SORGH_AS_0500]MDR6195857.1 hypothetical protein [Siphonobacter sp. SORGH_AS_0500]